MRLALLVGLSAAGLAAPSFAVDGDDVVDSAIAAHHLAVRRAPPHPKLPAPSQALALKPSAVIKFSMTLPRESAEAARTSARQSIYCEAVATVLHIGRGDVVVSNVTWLHALTHPDTPDPLHEIDTFDAVLLRLRPLPTLNRNLCRERLRSLSRK